MVWMLRVIDHSFPDLVVAVQSRHVGLIGEHQLLEELEEDARHVALGVHRIEEHLALDLMRREGRLEGVVDRGDLCSSFGVQDLEKYPAAIAAGFGAERFVEEIRAGRQATTGFDVQNSNLSAGEVGIEGPKRKHAGRLSPAVALIDQAVIGRCDEQRRRSFPTGLASFGVQVTRPLPCFLA